MKKWLQNFMRNSVFHGSDLIAHFLSSMTLNTAFDSDGSFQMRLCAGNSNFWNNFQVQHRSSPPPPPRWSWMIVKIEPKRWLVVCPRKSFKSFIQNTRSAWRCHREHLRHLPVYSKPKHSRHCPPWCLLYKGTPSWTELGWCSSRSMFIDVL